MKGCGYRVATGLLFAAFAAVLSASADFDAVVKSADAARDSGAMDKAVTLYRQALHIQPDWRQGWWVLGSILYDTNRYQEAAEAFLPLTVLDPDKSLGFAMAGLCEFEIQHYRDALSHLQQAAHLGVPESLYDATQYHIALILIRVGEFDQALELISRYGARAADNPKLVEAMGLAALRRPILPSGIPAVDHDLIMALGKAMCNGAAGRGKEAAQAFGELAAAHPTTSQLHYLYGLVLLQSDTDKALAEFRRELELSPKHVPSLISIAAEFIKRNEYETALPFAEEAVKYAPQYFAAHATLGKVLVEGNLDAQRGIKELEAAVKMAPANPQSRLALAAAYTKAGRKADAAAQRAEFLRLRTEIDSSLAVQQ